MLEGVVLELNAISQEGFFPEENEWLGWEGEWGNPIKKAKRFCSSWRDINDYDASKNRISLCPQESGDDEYQGDQSDTEDEVDSDFDIDEGDEPSSDGEAEEPRRKRRVVTKAYKVLGKSWFSWTSLIPIFPFIRSQYSLYQSRFLQSQFSLKILISFLLIKS